MKALFGWRGLLGIGFLALLVLTIWMMETQGRWAGVAIGGLWVFAILAIVVVGGMAVLYKSFRK